ncbi:MAG: CpsD/CapB family tyrosine-protein kinase [Bacteroidota bacterium]|nr:CpsD/CapB family tyrosine-protein kinase [Bacteroidota bacterium]
MQVDDIPSSDNEVKQENDNNEGDIKIHSLVRLKKKVFVNDKSSGFVDEQFVSPKFYNSFNYSILPSGNAEGKMVIGVTSASPKDGKTLVAANLGVSLALARERSTVLIDLNIGRPQLHKVFGMPLSPGLLDALHESSIYITETKFKNLSVLPAGNVTSNPANDILLNAKNEKTDEINESNLGLLLEQLPEFRNIIYSLLESYDSIIVDLPSMRDITVPPLFMSQLDGVIIVVTAGVSKQEDIDKIVTQLEQHQILGFVMNRAT